MMQEYIRRVRGEPPQQPTHPLLLRLLPETKGVMIYQEDVIKVGHELAGLTLAEADLLRRAMSGKLRSSDRMNALRRAFYRRLRKERHRHGQRAQHLAAGVELRRLQLLQGAFGVVRQPELESGLPQGAPPGGLHGRRAQP